MKWAENEDLLRRHNPGGDWVLFGVARGGIEGKVYRDPASQTGYVLEGGRIAPQHLSVVRQWRVGP